MTPEILVAVAAIFALAIGIAVGMYLGWNRRKRVAEHEIGSAEEEATRIVNEAYKSAESKKREANAQGTKMILLYMLERLYEEYKLQNYVTHEQRDRFFEIYNAYHNLGGNGYGTALWETVEGLDIRNDVDGVSPFVKMLKEMNKGKGE